MDGYKFLMQNYRAGDRICLFGFSRGAYTARALGGMLYKVGLLPKDNPEQVTFAYKLYKRTDDAGVALAAGFKQTFSQDVKVCFLGVWDTVASVGIISGRTLPFVNSNKAITHFRHAISLDERRAKFRPNFYHRPEDSTDPKQPASKSFFGLRRRTNTYKKNPDGPSIDDFISLSKKAQKIMSKQRLNDSGKALGAGDGPSGPSDEDEDMEDEPVITDVKEVWFAGCHSDVGGGADSNDTKYSLSHITLRWMVREVMNSSCGIMFDEAQLLRWNIPLQMTPPPSPLPPSSPLPSPSSPLRKTGPKSPARQVPDTSAQDALAPLDDQLKKNILWWILELFPLHYSWQDAKNVWHREYTFHLGKGREVLDVNPYFHTTVKTRMEDAKLKYKPKAKWNHGTETYVD
jgi:hypothetical protein